MIQKSLNLYKHSHESVLLKVVLYIFVAILIAMTSSTVTYFLLLPQIQRKTLVQNQNTQTFSPSTGSTTTNTTPNFSGSSTTANQEKVDVQQDNQTIDGSSQSEQVVLHGPRDKNRIALTFDAEMTMGMRENLLTGITKSSYDKRIVDTLNQTQTKATFFLTGMWITLYPDVTRELAKNPLFELGSHSFTDSSFSGKCYGLTELSDTQAVEQVGSTEFLLKIYGGIENILFRFPGGCYSQKNLDLITQANDTVVHWDVTGGDGFNNNTQQIITNVVNATQNGSIIILHLNGAPTAPKTAEALPSIIKALKAKGFEFVKVSELLNLQPEIKTNP